MESLYAQLYEALQEQIKSEVPEIRYIDVDLGQLDYYETRPGVSWPCVMIDFIMGQWSNESGGVQWGDFTVNIRLGFAPFSSANSLAPDVVQEKALQYFEVEWKLYKALQGFDADGLIQPMTRVSDGTEKREDPFRVRNMAFATSAEDHSAQHSNKVEADPEFDLGIDL